MVTVSPPPRGEQNQVPQPVRGQEGGTDPGPRNISLDQQNPDILTPPSTDAGTIPNLKFPFSLAHNRLQEGGWARQVTVRELPISTTLAGVNMRLNGGAIRELHWHKEAEWAYMLQGRARISAVDQDGRNFLDDVGVGDLWNFPAGIPHSIQGLEEGCEFLLVFDDGNFSEDSTFLITDWFAHTPRAVLAKNFGVAERDLATIPTQNLDRTRYIFPGNVPGPLTADRVTSQEGQRSFSYRLLAQEPIKTSGGTVRIVDSTTFPAATTIAAALVELEPGGLRELHWHPTNDEWQYYIEGNGRMTVFAAEHQARTFDYQAGDVGYVPFAMGHYIENTGDTPLRFLEMFKSPRYADVSLSQWMALTPPELVQAHLNLNEQMMGKLRKEKMPVVADRVEPTPSQRLRTLLRENRLCVLATAMPDGTPESAVMHYSLVDHPLRLFFSTDERSTKVRDTVKNGQASVVVGWSAESRISAQMRGEVRELTDPAALAAAKVTHYARNPDLAASEKNPHTVFLVFTPRWIRYSDMSRVPPLIEEGSEDLWQA